ncbi:peptide ABC transporter permease [Mycobacteroides immunogenum]|uniref:Peptide ABC transporter permease n=2 Tax=Mycobacteroides immunogenum TaxID=83262 RepID=A0A7V8RXQ6_9MYCO|nr:peptide ABC transporter permease [Mycobacteroides immunogenum]ANO07156.1 peptide ABC transporter permease [Mycobacteroides immunogenum]KIU40271.1 peptide ABC transporter permease [Mycobacteroides immunogenum]KPG13830.1 peptide ABC transporter permease [Mycobacteroides immunogenum]KPG14399.1 peptide ABC transporter permease [Mycobacteroides immunogenum]
MVPNLRLSLLTASLILLVVLLAAAFPGLFAPADPTATDYTVVLRPPSADHPFGTDQLGRDVYTRVVHGTRTSVVIGFGSTGLALAVGAAVGLVAAFGWRGVDFTVMRIVDIGLAFPSVLLSLLVLAVLGPGALNVLVAIAISSIPGYARLIRTEAQRVRAANYVRSAIGLGVRPARILRTHILPNALGPALVLATISAGTNIIVAAGLSFLGFGAAAPAPEWGRILADGRSVLAGAWWMSVFPGAAITLVVIAITVLGNAFERKRSGL